MRLLICIALFSQVIMGTACAKKLNGRGLRTNVNSKASQSGRKLNAGSEQSGEFIPEASLYGIVPVPMDTEYGYIPWQRPYKYYNAEESSVYQVTHNWDYGSSEAYYFTDDLKTIEDGVGSEYTVLFYHNDNLIELNEPGVFDCRIMNTETYYNRNTTEFRQATYDDRNGDYNRVEVPPNLSAPITSIVLEEQEGVEVDNTGNLIILGTLMAIPLTAIVICILGCVLCRRERLTNRRTEFETPIGETVKPSLNVHQEDATPQHNKKVLIVPPPPVEFQNETNEYFTRQNLTQADGNTCEQFQVDSQKQIQEECFDSMEYEQVPDLIHQEIPISEKASPIKVPMALPTQNTKFVRSPWRANGNLVSNRLFHVFDNENVPETTFRQPIDTQPGEIMVHPGVGMEQYINSNSDRRIEEVDTDRIQETIEADNVSLEELPPIPTHVRPIPEENQEQLRIPKTEMKLLQRQRHNTLFTLRKVTNFLGSPMPFQGRKSFDLSKAKVKPTENEPSEWSASENINTPITRPRKLFN